MLAFVGLKMLVTHFWDIPTGAWLAGGDRRRRSWRRRAVECWVARRGTADSTVVHGDRRRGRRAGPGGRPTSSRSSASTSALKRVGQRLGRACARSTARRRRRSRSTPRWALPLLRLPARAATPSRSSGRSSTSTSSARSSGSRPAAGIRSATRPPARARAASDAAGWSRRWQQAVDWYHERLLTAPDAGPARRYLRSRGFDGDIVRQFRIGWAPDGLGRASSGRSAVTASVLQDAGPRLRQPGAAACRTSSAAGCCSRSSTPRATRWRSAGACLPGGDGPKYKNTARDAALPQEPGRSTA